MSIRILNRQKDKLRLFEGFSNFFHQHQLFRMQTKPSPLLLVNSFVVGLFILAGCAGNASNQNKTAAQENAQTSKPNIEGAWELIWSKTNGKVDNLQKPLQLKLFSDGFFCLIMQDSTGKWTQAGGGTYETDGRTYKETFRYCTFPDWVGTTDWQEYELRGDTLYKKLFTKIVTAKGEDITAQYPKIEEKRVRARR